MKRKKLARIVDAVQEITPAEPVSLKSHKGFDEGWLENQIAKKPEILELTDSKLEVVRSELRHYVRC